MKSLTFSEQYNRVANNVSMVITLPRIFLLILQKFKDGAVTLLKQVFESNR